RKVIYLRLLLGECFGMRQQRAQEFLGISRSIETFERERLVVSHLGEFLYAHFFKIAFVVGSTLPPLTRGSIVAQALKGCAQPEIDVKEFSEMTYYKALALKRLNR